MNQTRLQLLHLAQVLLPAPGRYLATAAALRLGADYTAELNRLQELDRLEPDLHYGRWVTVWRACAAGELENAESILRDYMGLSLPTDDRSWWLQPTEYLRWLASQGLTQRAQTALEFFFAGDVEQFYLHLYPELGEESRTLIAKAMALLPTGA